MSTVTESRAAAGMAGFEATTNRWGRVTMMIGLALSLIGPVYVAFFTGMDLAAQQIWLAFIGVAAAFGVLWVLEPVTYFPILGSSAMYQAFMIGNISNKLLPAAIVAQSSIGAKAGTRRGDLTAVMAICGAATVHLVSLLVFVGFLGTWLISVIPSDVIEVARLYILPSVLGAVLVQAVVTMRQLRPTLIAVGLSLLFLFVVVPAFPTLGLFATAIVVVLAIALSWLLRDRNRHTGRPADATTESQP
ncbi:hypothetical protein ACQ7DA_00170 [Zafaria sp. J156]|uniref:hypothetical protein n=1 Tax=Zafaria sp. J156 TaxID=3116490 RepID=UPI002E7690E5|nr:hypothetical protein [Zafaria sp. J156]MEE1619800.1 hypothetical protein [Zafaria sp. J156]